MASFEIKTHASKQDTLNRMESAVNEVNGEFHGNVDKGSFVIRVAVGKIKGTYELYDSYILVNIKKKPFLGSIRMIEEALTGFIKSKEEE